MPSPHSGAESVLLLLEKNLKLDNAYSLLTSHKTVQVVRSKEQLEEAIVTLTKKKFHVRCLEHNVGIVPEHLKSVVSWVKIAEVSSTPSSPRKRGAEAVQDSAGARGKRSQSPPIPHRVAVFSGGSALNSAVQRLRRMIPNLAYIMTVSDDGGSSREIMRVLGGPSIGDIRSRLVRLARKQSVEKDNPKRSHLSGVRKLLNHRLNSSSGSHKAAREEFMSIVDGSHQLWAPIPEKFKQILRAFLVHFFTQVSTAAPIATRTRRKPHARKLFGIDVFAQVLQWESVQERPTWDNHDHTREEAAQKSDLFHFDFTNGSIGNFVLTGARMFFNSLEV